MTQTVPTAQPSIFERRESAVRSYCRAFPTRFASARGSVLTDLNGRDYIDFLAGCSTLNYGHNHPELKRALLEYIEADGIAHGLDLHTNAKANFLQTFERLILAPRHLDHRVMFTGPTGANAVEAALKIARKVTNRERVIAFTNGFHGMTLGALAATGNARKRSGAGIGLGGVVHEAYDGYFGPDIDTAELLARKLEDPSSGLEAPAAFLVECVQGEGGLNVASNAWLRKIEQLARQHGAMLIIDDIQAGCGRTDGFFGFERAGIKPDIITLAKSLSGLGLPFALTLIRPQFDQWSPGEHNGTFRGNNHAFVTATRALELFWSDRRLQDEVMRKGRMVAEHFEELQELSPLVVGTRGLGMMRGLVMSSSEAAEQVCKACFERGLIIETSGAHDEVVKVLCPLTIADAQLRTGLEIISAAVRQVDAAHKARAMAECGLSS